MPQPDHAATAESARPGPGALIGRLSAAFASALLLVLGLDLVWDLSLGGREGPRAAAVLFDLFTYLFALTAGFITGLRGWLTWKSESCELGDAGLTIVRRRHRTFIPWEALKPLQGREGPLAEALGIRNLRIRAGGRTSLLQGYPEAFEARIRAMAGAAAFPVLSDCPAPESLSSLNENESLEFKSSLRWNLREGRVDRAMEHAVLKTVAAFLNASGGLLAIGVDDSGRPIGLGNDYSTLPRKDSDGFENHLRQLIAQQIGQRFLVFVKIRFADTAGSAVCFVRVLPAPEPAFLRSGEGDAFFLRTGNATSSLPLGEACAYIASGRFPR